MFHSLVCGIYAFRTKKPYMLSPHGMLEPRAFAVRRWKKAPVWRLWEKRVVENAAVIHCTSEAEACHVRELGFRQPIAVIPVGVEAPKEWKKEQTGGKERTVLFFSRIHPIKGLSELIDAWSIAWRDGWMLRIAGPGDQDYIQVVERMAKRAAPSGSIKLSGASYGEEKWRAFRSADLFVLPSRSENFGNVVTEALVSGLPVITTTGTPWEALEEQGCGWWVEPTPKGLARALQEGMSMSDEERLAMGARGRAWAIEEFSCQKIAAEMLSVYDWVLGRGERPGCVRLD